MSCDVREEKRGNTRPAKFDTRVDECVFNESETRPNPSHASKSRGRERNWEESVHSPEERERMQLSENRSRACVSLVFCLGDDLVIEDPARTRGKSVL